MLKSKAGRLIYQPTNRLIYQPAYTLPGRPRQIPIPVKNPPKTHLEDISRRYIRVTFASRSEYWPPVSLLCFLPDVRLSRKKTGFPKNAFSQRRRPAACGLMYTVHQSSQTLFSAASKCFPWPIAFSELLHSEHQSSYR